MSNVSTCDICGKRADTLAYHPGIKKWCCITCIAQATYIERSESEYPGLPWEKDEEFFDYEKENIQRNFKRKRDFN